MNYYGISKVQPNYAIKKRSTEKEHTFASGNLSISQIYKAHKSKLFLSGH